MNKEKLTSDVVLGIATEQITNNGSTTTLDVKKQLRTEDKYEAFQWEISKFMQDLYNEGKLASTNDASRPYQIYDLPQTPAVSVAPTLSATPVDMNATIQNLLGTTKNRATVWILGNLHLIPITRKQVKDAGFGDSQVDTALTSLVKKGIITRVDKGEYAAVSGQTPSSQPSDQDKKIQEMEQLITEKNQKIAEMEQKLATSAKLIEAAHSELITQ